MRFYWWLHGKLTRGRRARRWAEGIRIRFDDAAVSWDVGNPSPEFANSAFVTWADIAGVAERGDDGTAPAGLMVLQRNAASADFLPLESEGARAFLDAARRRNLIRPYDALVAEREANERRRGPP